jgi:hypothetical protein
MSEMRVGDEKDETADDDAERVNNEQSAAFIENENPEISLEHSTRPMGICTQK